MSEDDAAMARPDLAPGDEVPPSTEDAGEDLCPQCGGSGRVDGEPCPNCGGSGRVIVPVGGG
jgi:RecJ-like exonuclease